MNSRETPGDTGGAGWGRWAGEGAGGSTRLLPLPPCRGPRSAVISFAPEQPAGLLAGVGASPAPLGPQLETWI